MSYVVNTSKFKKNMRQYEKEVQAGLSGVMKKAASSYAVKASQYVPPRANGKWSKNIPAAMYKRKIYPLSALVKKDAKNRKEYAEKLRQGFRFVVPGKLHGKPHKWFATTLRNAKKHIRIYNRGLFKVMFGVNLQSIGEAVPPIFQRLLSKSPNLSGHINLNELQLKTGDEISVKISNKAFGNQSFARQAVYQGDKAAKKTIKKEFEQLNKRVYNV